MVCQNDLHSTENLNHLIRFTKQRKYVTDDSIIIKFVPIPFAVVLSNIILMIKPVEAEFAKTIYGTNPRETQSFLYTIQGRPVQAEKMVSILSETFGEYGMPIHVSELRHALDAFAHKLGKPSSGWDPFLAIMANHSFQTSARYGRDENATLGVPADITEGNALSCNRWNTLILNSPSMEMVAGGTIYQHTYIDSGYLQVMTQRHLGQGNTAVVVCHRVSTKVLDIMEFTQ